MSRYCAHFGRGRFLQEFATAAKIFAVEVVAALNVNAGWTIVIPAAVSACMMQLSLAANRLASINPSASVVAMMTAWMDGTELSRSTEHAMIAVVLQPSHVVPG
jgi:hypothetical protein